MLLYIRQEGLTKVPVFGSLLVVRGQLNAVPPPLNPGVFNYQEYLAVQGICCQAFITADQLGFAGTEAGFPIKMLAKDVRSWALTQIEKYVEGDQERAIVSSLVLGYRESLDNDLVQAYSTAGTMHVLAVSGLHVGILYLFLKFIFQTWRRNPKLKWLSFLGTLLVLWSYALVTGLSPSVMRAAWMFCMIDAAFLLKRKTSIYNTLALAAFGLLVLDPNMLWTVGFQLSFLAVLGIVYLQPRLSAWYVGDNKIVRKIWDLLAVSLAAQFATFPLGLYYFGQFPTYFFLTNLVVVPLVFFILALGFGMLLFSLFSSSIAAAAGWLLNGLVGFINRIVFTAEAFPYSRLTTHITELQLWLLASGLLLLLLFFHFRKLRQALAMFFFFGFLITSLLVRTYQQKEQRKLIVYQIPGYSILQLIEGRKEFFMADADLPSSQIRYQVQPNRASHGLLTGNNTDILQQDFHPAFESGAGYSLIVWRGLKIVKVDRELADLCPQNSPLKVDYILLTHNAVKDLATINCYFKGGTLLIDGSNQRFVEKKLKQQAEKLNLPYHLTSQKGAFELNL